MKTDVVNGKEKILIKKEDFIKFDKSRDETYKLESLLRPTVEHIHKIFYNVYSDYNVGKYRFHVSYMSSAGINEIYVEETGFRYDVFEFDSEEYSPSVGTFTRFIPYELLSMSDDKIYNYFKRLKFSELKKAREAEREKRKKHVDDLKESRRKMYKKLHQEFGDIK